MDSCRMMGWSRVRGHSPRPDRHLLPKLPPATGCPASGQGEMQDRPIDGGMRWDERKNALKFAMNIKSVFSVYKSWVDRVN